MIPSRKCWNALKRGGLDRRQKLAYPRCGELAARVEPTATRDGPDNVYVPLTQAEWTELGITPPDYSWGCQDASGDMTAAFGGKALSPDGVTAGISYRNSIAGWTRKFVGLTGNGSNRLTRTDAALRPALDQSFAGLVYGAINNSGATRGIFSLGGQDEWSMAVETDGYPQCRTAGNNHVAGAVASFASLTDVQPVLYVRDCIAGTTKMYTKNERVVGVHAASQAAVGDVGFGGPGMTAAEARYCLGAIWMGSSAVGLDQRVLEKLGWILTYD